MPLAVIGSSIQLPGDINDRERFLEIIRDKVQVRCCNTKVTQVLAGEKGKGGVYNVIA